MIEFRKRLINDLVRVKSENTKLRNEVSKSYSKSVEFVSNTHSLDVESLIDEFYEQDQELVGHDLSAYTVYIPKDADHTNHIRSCKGCGQQFKTTCNGSSLIPFYEHCIRNCEQYKRLNLIRSCEACRLLFVNSYSYGIHVNSDLKCELSQRHRDKPDWAPKSVKQWNAMNCRRQWNTSTNCLGCGQQFRARKSPSGGLIKEMAYYRHCFDECEEYKKLNKICSCDDCRRKFLNGHALNKHCQALGHTNNSHTSSYVCEGCGQNFERSAYGRKKYVKNCIEACDEYRELNLVTTCSECEKSFMNENALTIHRSHKHPKK